MTTNNHPAHGPVSLDRLHQIREILSKASAQSDGGNLGYAMADAVKVIDGAIASFGAAPVLYAAEETLAYAKMGELHLKCLSQPMGDAVIPLYRHAQPVPVVPVEMNSDKAWGGLKISAEDCQAWSEGWNACRAAMLQAGNSPVTPDGWIPVSDRMPERDVDVQVYCADKKEQMVGYMERNETEGWFRFASLPNGGGVYCKPTHWMPLPASPQQEVK
ncbi:DUF551 domain-containing protein [Salmonella enterica]|uniref:DUF551 domain-containing protein n=1 Tax=Salmonella enterica TaxID=28901 RepID=UPI000D56BECE|nr:DUF551 domain-containing protein [Salmonella enterica]EBV6221016.1 DUF551 domain-containing protein [Salmonella enterica subsp. enterica serovar Minnesota]PVN20048.1 hypothetical protein C4766_16840 [Salmonella enterica subsp. enterica serovar Minnesota]